MVWTAWPNHWYVDILTCVSNLMPTRLGRASVCSCAGNSLLKGLKNQYLLRKNCHVLDLQEERYGRTCCEVWGSRQYEYPCVKWLKFSVVVSRTASEDAYFTELTTLVSGDQSETFTHTRNPRITWIQFWLMWEHWINNEPVLLLYNKIQTTTYIILGGLY